MPWEVIIRSCAIPSGTATASAAEMPCSLWCSLATAQSASCDIHTSCKIKCSPTVCDSASTILPVPTAQRTAGRCVCDAVWGNLQTGCKACWFLAANRPSVTSAQLQACARSTSYAVVFLMLAQSACLSFARLATTTRDYSGRRRRGACALQVDYMVTRCKTSAMVQSQLSQRLDCLPLLHQEIGQALPDSVYRLSGCLQAPDRQATDAVLLLGERPRSRFPPCNSRFRHAAVGEDAARALFRDADIHSRLCQASAVILATRACFCSCCTRLASKSMPSRRIGLSGSEFLVDPCPGDACSWFDVACDGLGGAACEGAPAEDLL
jgi:hypothetical protein